MVSRSALRGALTMPAAREGEHDAMPVVPPPGLSRYTPLDQPTTPACLMLYQPFFGVPLTTVTVAPLGITWRIAALFEADARRFRFALVTNVEPALTLPTTDLVSR